MGLALEIPKTNAKDTFFLQITERMHILKLICLFKLMNPWQGKEHDQVNTNSTHCLTLNRLNLMVNNEVRKYL